MRLYAPLHPDSIEAIYARRKSRDEFWSMVASVLIVMAISAAMITAAMA